MDYFNYNNNTFYVNDIILLKFKSRILKYKINFIHIKQNEYYSLNITNIDYDIHKTIKLPLHSNKFIRKYFMYKEPPIIKCDVIRKNYLIYKIHCDFCNTIHKHNYLGHQDCRCNSPFSPYQSSGYILELNIDNFNDYLLYNFELYLKKIDFGGWSSYKLSVKKFYEGSVCNKYGKNIFPYITEDTIKYIKINYNEDNLKCSNGCLVAGLRSFIKMILLKNISYIDKKYTSDINKLYKFYKVNKRISKLEKIDLLKNIISSSLNNNKNKEITTKNKEITTKNEEITTKNEEITTKNEEITTKNKEITTKKLINKTTDMSKDKITHIKLDLDCGVEDIMNLSVTNINNIISMINNDYPYFKDKYFYKPNDIQIYSKYLNIYDDMWLCIYKLKKTKKNTIYCVDEADCYDPNFIEIKMNITN